MNFVGFITEHEHPIAIPSTAIELFKRDNYDAELKDKVVNYLKSGKVAWGYFMEAIKPLLSATNKDDSIIYGYAYLTDGKWIWPNYFTYYFENFDFQIEEKFLKHMIENNFEVPAVGANELKELNEALIALSRS